MQKLKCAEILDRHRSKQMTELTLDQLLCAGDWGRTTGIAIIGKAAEANSASRYISGTWVDDKEYCTQTILSVATGIKKNQLHPIRRSWAARASGQQNARERLPQWELITRDREKHTMQQAASEAWAKLSLCSIHFMD